MLVVMLVVAVSMIPVMGLMPVSSPPAGTGDGDAEDQRGDSSDLHANGMPHVTLNDQQWLTRNQMAMIGMGIPSTSPITYFIRASSRSWLVCVPLDDHCKLRATP
jgi:hypothetical protein